MLLEFIRVERFKTLLDIELQLGRLNIFSGLNGMGKSSVIQALLLLRQSYELNALQRRGLVLNGKYTSLGVGTDALSTAASIESIEFDLQWEGEELLQFKFNYSPESDIQPAAQVPDDNKLEGLNLFGDAFQYLSADRVPPKTLHEVSDFNVRLLNSIGNHGEYAVHYISEYGTKDLANPNLKHASQESTRFIENLNSWMSEISPGIRVLATHEPKLNIANLTYSFKQNLELTNEFKPQNVGFGLSYVLPVVVAILRAKPGDLVIIENPESHLHPAGQSMIGKMCAIAAQAGVQLIIETHSDHFLNGIRIAIKDNHILCEDVFLNFFKRNTESDHYSRLETPQINQDGRINFWPEGFFDEWDKSLGKLL